MKAAVQRVGYAALSVDGALVSQIGRGLVVFFGVKAGDEQSLADKLAYKIARLRIFEDEKGKMNLSVKDVQGEVLLVSQFTLYGDCSHGNRPGFDLAEKPERANAIYEYFKAALIREGLKVSCGIFGADMKINQLNDGPVTIIYEF